MNEYLNMFVGGVSGITSFVPYIMGFICLIGLIVIINDMRKFNKGVRIFALRGGKTTSYITKGSKTTDKRNITVFETKRFGRDNEKIKMNNLSNEKFYEQEGVLWNMPYFPFILKECIDFFSPKKGVYIPVRHSFLSFKRGEDLHISPASECDCCKAGIDLTDFMKNPEKFPQVNTFNNLCERCVTELINVRYECIDDSDLSYYWTVIDEIEKKYGEMFAKYAILVISALCLILVGFTIYCANKYYPDIQEAVSSSHQAVYDKVINAQINAQYYNNSLPTN